MNYSRNKSYITLEDISDDLTGYQNKVFDGIDLETGEAIYKTREIHHKQNIKNKHDNDQLLRVDCPNEYHGLLLQEVELDKSLKNTPRIDSNKKDDKCIDYVASRSAESRYGPFLRELINMNSRFVPCHPKSKVPVRGFSYNEQKLMTNLSIQSYFDKYPNLNLGLKVGHGIVVMDFDQPGSYDVFRKQHKDLKTLVVKSGRATEGYHVYFKNRDVSRKSDMYMPGFDRKVGELMGNGYIMLPGTIHDKSGDLYRIVEGDFDSIAEVDADFLFQYQKTGHVPKHSSDNLTSSAPTSCVSSHGGDHLVDLVKQLPYQGFTLDEKFRMIPAKVMSCLTHRVAGDDYSKCDFDGIVACLYAGMTEDEVIEIAHRFPNGLGARYAEKQKKDKDYNYLREDYRRIISGFDMNRANNTARKHLGMNHARQAKLNKPKGSPADEAYKSIVRVANRQKTDVLTWRQMTDSKIFRGTKSSNIHILDELVESGKLTWVVAGRSVKLV